MFNKKFIIEIIVILLVVAFLLTMLVLDAAGAFRYDYIESTVGSYHVEIYNSNRLDREFRCEWFSQNDLVFVFYAKGGQVIDSQVASLNWCVSIHRVKEGDPN